MIGSAMRRPVIHAGDGSATLDSMMVGRTIESGSPAQTSATASSASALLMV